MMSGHQSSALMKGMVDQRQGIRKSLRLVLQALGWRSAQNGPEQQAGSSGGAQGLGLMTGSSEGLRVITEPGAMRAWSRALRARGRRVGLVCTMVRAPRPPRGAGEGPPGRPGGGEGR